MPFQGAFLYILLFTRVLPWADRYKAFSLKLRLPYISTSTLAHHPIAPLAH